MIKNKKYVVIFGATGGIGTAITKSVTDAGFTVIATGTKQNELLRLQKQFGKEKIVIYKINLEKLDTFNAFYLFVKNKTKNIEWVVHSAGFIDNEPSLKFDKKIIKKTFLVNTESVIAMTYIFLPMINIDGGIISISSTASLWGNPKYPIYSASKGALNVFARSLAKNISNSKQSSITICPGPTNTKMREKIAKDAHEKQDPNVIGEIVNEIIHKSTKYKNGDVIVAQDGITKIQSRLDD